MAVLTMPIRVEVGIRFIHGECQILSVDPDEWQYMMEQIIAEYRGLV